MAKKKAKKKATKKKATKKKAKKKAKKKNKEEIDYFESIMIEPSLLAATFRCALTNSKNITDAAIAIAISSHLSHRL